jgi:hypothetical protein
LPRNYGEFAIIKIGIVYLHPDAEKLSFLRYGRDVGAEVFCFHDYSQLIFGDVHIYTLPSIFCAAACGGRIGFACGETD